MLFLLLCYSFSLGKRSAALLPAVRFQCQFGDFLQRIYFVQNMTEGLFTNLFLFDAVVKVNFDGV